MNEFSIGQMLWQIEYTLTGTVIEPAEVIKIQYQEESYYYLLRWSNGIAEWYNEKELSSVDPRKMTSW